MPQRSSCSILVQVCSFIAETKKGHCGCVRSKKQNWSKVLSLQLYLLVKQLPLQDSLFQNCMVIVLVPFNEENYVFVVSEDNVLFSLGINYM